MIWRARFSALLFCLAPCAWGLSESSFPVNYPRKVQPFFASATVEILRGERDVAIAYRRFRHPPPSRGTIVVSDGYSEGMPKYAEVAYDLYQGGYSVVLFDHRGQGQSDHLLGNPQKAHIDDFENLVRDLHSLRTIILDQAADGPFYILGHSMGAAIAARDMEEHPEDFRAAVLSAPMLEMSVVPQSAWIHLMLNLVHALHLDGMYARGSRDPQTFTFAENSVTHSQLRYENLQIKPTQLNPELQVWGPTFEWVRQNLIGTAWTRNNGALVKAPVLIFQAGQDVLVGAEGQRVFCTLAEDCTLRIFPSAKHEILIETDEIRGPAMAETLQFFNSSQGDTP